MTPSVPFALLAAAQLLMVAAGAGLAGAALFPRLRSRGTALVVLGGLLLATVETVTAVGSGGLGTESLMSLRALALALVAGGFAAGSLTRLVPITPAGAFGVAPLALIGIATPLGAGVVPSVLAASAAGVAALAAARSSISTGEGRLRRSTLLAAAFVVVGASCLLALPARTSTTAAVLVLVLRALGALLVLAVLGLLARRSVLAKLVAAILAGVLFMAVAAVAVVGSVLASSFSDQQSEQAAAVAQGRLAALDGVQATAAQLAQLTTLCPQAGAGCAELFKLVGNTSAGRTFAAVVSSDGSVTEYGGRPLGDAATLAQLAGLPAVEAVRAGPITQVRTIVVLAGATPRVAVLGVAAPAGARPAGTPAPFVATYGVLLDDAYLLDSRITSGGYDLTLLVGGRVVASSLPPAAAAVVAEVAAQAPLRSAGATVPARSSRPTVHVRPLVDPTGETVGALAVSQGADAALAAERRALRDLFLLALVVTGVVAAVSLLVGRRVVEPVRRLTVAAAQVGRGDLDADLEAVGDDEIGTLSRVFGGMTASLRRSTAELRAAAEQESALRGRLETVLGSMSDGLVATDSDDLVTSINAAALTLLSLEESDALGECLTDVVPLVSEDGEPSLLLADAAAEGTTQLRRPGGALLPVAVASAPLADGGGRVVVLRDVSREREIERMKTEFLSNVSHELRTPLTPIRGYAEILARRPDLPPEKISAYVGTILEATYTMGRAVDLLVDVAAFEAGRVVAQPRATGVAELVEARLADWRRRAPARADDLRRRLPAALPAVYVDPRWVAKALDEFVDNALKYSQVGSAVTFVAVVDGDRVRLGVRDAGPGISDERLESVFSAFEQVDGSATRRIGGLGLGLSFVRRLGQEFGIEVRAESRPGRGSEFSLLLPQVADGDVDQAPVPFSGARRPDRRTRAQAGLSRPGSPAARR